MPTKIPTTILEGYTQPSWVASTQIQTPAVFKSRLPKEIIPYRKAWPQTPLSFETKTQFRPIKKLTIVPTNAPIAVANTYHQPKISLPINVIPKSAVVETNDATWARKKDTKVRGRSAPDNDEVDSDLFFI